MHVYLSMLGCRLNEAELESWSRDFRAAGHQVVAQPSQAQLMVLNTCAVTGEAARKSRKLVSGLHRQNPSANLVVTGCFAELEPERVAGLMGVDLVVGNRAKSDLVALVSDHFTTPSMPAMAMTADGAHMFAEPAADAPDSGPTTDADNGLVQLGRRPSPPTRASEPPTRASEPPTRASARTRAFIKVQDGCRNRCSFCIVTIARGEERSRTIDEVVAEIDSLHAAGYREAVLTGVHLGGYGRDLGTDLRALVAAVLERTAIPRVRLSSLEPWDLPSGFFQLWQNPRLMPHLHLPLQSGSDTVLKRMVRRCQTHEFAQLVADARREIADLMVTTDIIVGFPGETEQEWTESVAFAQSIGFAHMHIFSYSARAGTKAARLPDPVPNAEKRRRSRVMHELAARMKRSYLDQCVGQRRPILWEGEGTPGERGRRFVGYTDNYLRVETESEQSLGNRITDAQLLRVIEPGGRLLARVVP